MMQEFVGMVPEPLNLPGQLRYFRVLPKCFYLQPLPDTFISEGYLLGENLVTALFFRSPQYLHQIWAAPTASVKCYVFFSHTTVKLSFSIFYSITRSGYSLKPRLFFLVFERRRWEECLVNRSGRYSK